MKQEISQQPDTFMRLEDPYARDANLRDRDAGGQDRDADRRDVTNRDNDRRDVANFDRFLDGHREIAEQVRKDPSLLDNRNFVQNHPALQTYLQDNPGVRDQLRQNPNAFMRQEDAYDRDSNMRDRDPMHDHMADFGGFLHSHSDIQKDLSRNPSVVKDHEYVQNHAELDAYLNAHPDVRAELMANPQSFVHGAQQYNNASPSGTSGGAGVNSRPARSYRTPASIDRNFDESGDDDSSAAEAEPVINHGVRQGKASPTAFPFAALTSSRLYGLAQPGAGRKKSALFGCDFSQKRRRHEHQRYISFFCLPSSRPSR